MIEIKTSNCPVCGSPPHFTGILPYFCAVKSCKVISWDPTKTLDEILEAAPQIVNFNIDVDDDKNNDS